MSTYFKFLETKTTINPNRIPNVYFQVNEQAAGKFTLNSALTQFYKANWLKQLRLVLYVSGRKIDKFIYIIPKYSRNLIPISALQHRNWLPSLEPA